MSFYMIFLEKKKKYGAHSHVRATARLEEHIIHSRGQRYVVPLAQQTGDTQKQSGLRSALMCV